jgi:hypothetical protein
MSALDAVETDRSTAFKEQFVRRWGYNPGLAERMVYDSGTDEDMVDYVAHKLQSIDANEKWIAAVCELKMLVTELNAHLVTQEEADAWNAFIGEAPALPQESMAHVE